MPGSGKSTVARQLARRLQQPVFDCDSVIEARLGCSIRTYFGEFGEAAFRDIEAQVFDELTRTGGGSVIATGGGTVLRAENRERMRARGVVIYLRTSPEHIFSRLKRDTKRPLLQVDDPLRRLRALYAEREPLYREVAHHVVETRGQSLAMLVNRLAMQFDLTPGAQHTSLLG